MGGFVTSTSSVTQHGAFAIERTPPAVIIAAGTGVVGMVGQFPWGPVGSVIQPSDINDRALTIAPPGMPRTGSAYLATIRKAFPDLRLVRVVGPTAAAATLNLLAASTTIVTLTLLCVGASGNLITATVANASDGDANHFNLQVVITGASGTSTDTVQNLNYSGTGTDSNPDLSKLRLLGSIVKANSGRPTNGTFTFTGGSDGTVTSAEYVGTQGTGDKGLALLENDSEVNLVFSDDPGNTLRAAVNSGLVAHADYMGDRMAALKGNPGMTLAAAQADKLNYISQNAFYVDVWVKIYDDVDGTVRLVGPDAFAASVFAQLSPSTSIAWKNIEVRTMLGQIVDLETPRGKGAGSNNKKGLVTLIKEKKGGYTFEAGLTCATEADPARRNITRTRIGQYMAVSITDSLRPSVDAPNVPTNQADVVGAVQRFMKKLKKNQEFDPNHNPHVINFELLPPSVANSADSIAAGEYTIPLDVQDSSAMEKIFLSIRHGETVIITAT